MPSASPAPMFIIKEVLPVMKTTGDLMKALSFPEISPEDYLSANKEELLNSSPKELWTSLVERSGLRKAEIIRRSQFEAVYFDEVLAGEKIPSRDKVLRLLLGLQAELSDCQKILQLYGYRPLYPRIFRDVLLISSITNSLSLSQVQQLLEQHQEEPLK